MANEYPEATGRPWQIVLADKTFGDARFIIWGSRGPGHGAICRTWRQGLTATPDEAVEAEANAKLIVAAVNSYDALRAAAVAAAIPYEALLMDNESRKWIALAPEVWSAIEKAVEQLRAALHPQPEEMNERA